MDNGAKGRGAGINTRNRFSKLETEYISEEWQRWDDLSPNPKTRFIEEESKSLLSSSNSPDLGHFHSINPYRGCEHGCIYCYARNSHEFWGFSAGLDFETKIIVKKNAPQLLEKLFNSKNWQPACIHLSGNTDCYQPGEKTYKLTGNCFRSVSDTEILSVYLQKML